MLPDTTDSTKEFDLQCLAADFYLTVYNIDTTHQNPPTNYTISPNHPRNYGLAEHQAFFDSQTKMKDKYYTPKLPATNINDITFVRYVESLYSLFEDCPLFRVEYLLLPIFSDANSVPNITTVHTVLKWLSRKLSQSLELNSKATEFFSELTLIRCELDVGCTPSTLPPIRSHKYNATRKLHIHNPTAPRRDQHRAHHSHLRTSSSLRIYRESTRRTTDLSLSCPGSSRQ